MIRHRLTGSVVAIAVASSLQAQAAEWETDFAQASTNAAQAGRYLLLDFSGSDWCGWCMKLDKEVFSSKEFTDFAGANLVCVQLDFPRQKKQDKTLKEQNTRLAEKYGIQGFPTVLLLSPEGDLVETTGYREGGAKKYVDYLKEVMAKYEKQHPGKKAATTTGSDKPDTGKAR